MTDVADLFIKSVKEKINQQSSLSLPESVLSVDPISSNVKLFVGHKKELEALSTETVNCVKGVYKRIIIHGLAGVGKSSLVSVIGVASNKTDLGYKIIELDKSSYFYGFDVCYGEIVFLLCLYISGINREEAREMEHAKKYAKYSTLISTVLEKRNNIKKEDLVSEAVKSNILEKIDSEAYLTLIEELVKKLKNHKIALILDDFEMLLQEENKTLLQEIKSLLKIKDLFSILIMHTETLKMLIRTQDELVKDTSIVEILPLTRGELKELLWRRIMHFVKEIKNFDNTNPDYNIDLYPFNEEAVNMLADATGGNPLVFIKTLKDAIGIATERSMPSITTEIAQAVIEKRTKTPENLTIKEKQVLEFIKSKGEVIIEDVKNFQGKSRIAAFFTLDDMYKKKILDKKRRGREMHYFIVQKQIL